MIWFINKIGAERVLRFIDAVENFNPAKSFYVKYWVFLVTYTGVCTVVSRALF